MEPNQNQGQSQEPVEAPMPEQNAFPQEPVAEKKTGNGMLIGMILCALIALGGVGFGVWAMMDGNTQKEQLNSQISALKSQVNELQEKISTGPGDGTEKIDTDTDTSNSWDIFSRKLATQSVYIMGYYSHYNGTSNERYMAYAMKDANGHLVITDAGNNMSDNNPVILELDDVLSVYYIKVGNGSVPYFYIVGLNGGVSRIDISENSNRQLEKVGEYTRIATVLEAASSEAILVDIDGNIYKSY
ncbi:MAG: hypothetical protein Q4A70_02080 [Candidatus Saccharibacteria bacterium]|nr:hypothetical protein [Candidatus Saccharibacteria bacterium]